MADMTAKVRDILDKTTYKYNNLTRASFFEKLFALHCNLLSKT